MNTIAVAHPRKYSQLPRFFRWFSDRCVLRQIDESDVARIWSAVSFPGFDRCWTAAMPRSVEDVAAFVKASQLDWQRGTRYAMAVLRKQTHDFVGWIELRTTNVRGAWTIDWFIHPRFVGDVVAREALAAGAALLFGTLDAVKLFARCPQGLAHFERLLNQAGFIEVAAAGSLNRKTGQPRNHAVYELGRGEWVQMRRTDDAALADGGEASPYATSWVASGKRAELQLV